MCCFEETLVVKKKYDIVFFLKQIAISAGLAAKGPLVANKILVWPAGKKGKRMNLSQK